MTDQKLFLHCSRSPFALLLLPMKRMNNNFPKIMKVISSNTNQWIRRYTLSSVFHHGNSKRAKKSLHRKVAAQQLNNPQIKLSPSASECLWRFNRSVHLIVICVYISFTHTLTMQHDKRKTIRHREYIKHFASMSLLWAIYNVHSVCLSLFYVSECKRYI